MATLGDLRTRIADELQVDATTWATEIDRAIFSAIKFYDDADFWFLEASPATVVLSLTSAYPLASLIPDRSQIRNVLLQYGRDNQPLLYRTQGEFGDIQTEFTGDPTYWTINNDRLLVDPVPTRTFSAVVWYSKIYSMTASASASSVWTNEGEEMIRLHAKVDILANRMKDFAEAAQVQGRLKMVLDNLGEKSVQRRASRRLRPHL